MKEFLDGVVSVFIDIVTKFDPNWYDIGRGLTKFTIGLFVLILLFALFWKLILVLCNSDNSSSSQ